MMTRDSIIFVTGDLHANARGEMDKLTADNFPQQREMTKEDYVIICGDFGWVWHNEESKEERWWLNWLDERNFTTLFIDGNHENHDKLNSYPVEEWHGGKVHKIRPSVIHLMRGQVFEIGGKTFATMGGAPSHDIQDGIFDPADYLTREDMMDAIHKLIRRKGGWPYTNFRIKGESWWEREQPSSAEWNEWYKNLDGYDFNVDYILTHEAPASVVPFVSIFNATDMSDTLEKFRQCIDYKHWFFGHYHLDRVINDKETVVYDKMIRIM